MTFLPSPGRAEYVSPGRKPWVGAKKTESRRDDRKHVRPNQNNNVVQNAVGKFLSSLRQRNASRHTIKAYSGDLENFSAYIGSRQWREIDHVTVRGFLSHLYEKGLGKTSVARSLAAVRSLYRWLAQEGMEK